MVREVTRRSEKRLGILVFIKQNGSLGLWETIAFISILKVLFMQYLKYCLYSISVDLGYKSPSKNSKKDSIS
jgi:hypothetical protein